MKRLITLIAVVLLAAACGEKQTVDNNAPLSFIDMHCREHDRNFIEYTPEIYNECMQLHMNGLV